MSHETFKKSEACQEIVGFITALANAVQKSRMTETPITDVMIPAIIDLEPQTTFRAAWNFGQMARWDTSYRLANEIRQ